MSSISQCQYDIKRYKILKNNINSIIFQLSQVIENTDDFNNEIKTKYQINDNYTPIVSRTIQLKDNMESTNKYLINKVIPAIDSAINNLNNKIVHLEEESQQKNKEQANAYNIK